MRRFENFNPIVLSVYYMAVIIPIMLLMNPLLITIGLVSGLVRMGLYDKKIPVKRILFSGLLVIIMTVVNAFLVHQGETEFFFINGRAITLESVKYGAVSGLMLSAALVWFSDFSHTVTGEKIMALLWRLPRLALLISMIVRLIPRYLKRYHKVSLAMKINEETDSKTEKNQVMKMTSAVFTWALENSMDTADSMMMKGYVSGRKKISGLKFNAGDVIMLAVIAALQIMYFLPGMWHAALMFIMCFLPEIYRIKENIKWEIYTLKI